MQKCYLLILLSFSNLFCFSQDISGKWFGKVTQGPGGYSELYDLELDLKQKKVIRGQSYAYIPNILSVRIGLNGYIDGDTVRLSESLFAISEEQMPPSWVACIKNINVKYYKAGASEFLRGNWNGKSKDDNSDCIPGEIILSRTKEDIAEFLAADGFRHPFRDDTISLKPTSFMPTFLNTSIKPVEEIEVKNRNIELRINDYLNIDDDSVSLYLNRGRLLGKTRISKKPIRIKVALDKDRLNEILIYAENLGNIPPNTSQLVIIDGTNTHRLIIESDKQKSAAIYLNYNPK